MNGTHCAASDTVQCGCGKLVLKVGSDPIESFTGAHRSVAERTTTMFRKTAIALIAATLFAGPVFAQGTAAPAPAKHAQSKVVVHTVKTVKPGRHHVRKQVKHVKYIKHARHMTYVRHAKHVRHLHRGKIVARAHTVAIKPTRAN